MKSKHSKNHLVVLLAELLIFVSIFGVLIGTASRPMKALALGELTVGGFFAPGVFDIFTPSPCGLLVTVIGPRPGVFIWTPTIYRGLYEHPTHVGDFILGVATPPLGLCPPALTIVYGTTSYFMY